MIQLHLEHFMHLWFGVVGAAIGSFLNVVIFRVPRGFRIGLPSRSACIACKARLPWYENIPVAGYIFLRAKCRKCRAKISARYPLVELMTAVLFVALYRRFGFSFETFYYCAFAAALIAVTFIDVDFRIIPDVISFPGIAIGVAASAWVSDLGLVSSALGAGFGIGFLWILGSLYERLTGREGIGFGDVKLLGMIGAFLGLRGALGAVVVSSLVGSVVGIVLVVAQKKSLKLAIPYGPFLAIGALVFLFWGDYIVFRIYPGYSL